jgi:hypothetical protein
MFTRQVDKKKDVATRRGIHSTEAVLKETLKPAIEKPGRLRYKELPPDFCKVGRG